MNEMATLHATVTATIRESMPDLVSVDAYTNVGNALERPALRHGVVRMTADAAPRDGRSVLIATFEADITADSANPEARLQGSLLAAQLMDLLRQQQWGLEFVEASRNVRAQYEGSAWSVSWEQPVLFVERSIAVEGFADGLDGQYLIDSVEQAFTASGWRTTVQCNGGKAGKVQAKGCAKRR